MEARSKDNGQSASVRSSEPFGNSHLSIPAAAIRRKCFQHLLFLDELVIVLNMKLGS